MDEIFEESPWHRVLRSGQVFRYVSKLETGEASVDYETFERDWMGWSPQEQAGFVEGFVRKASLTPDDEVVVAFLLHKAEPYVGSRIVHLLPRFRDRGLAMEVLKQSILLYQSKAGAGRTRESPLEWGAAAFSDGPLEGHFRVLGQIGDDSAVGFLVQQVEGPLDKPTVYGPKRGRNPDARDMITALGALARLDAEAKETWLKRLKGFRSHPNFEVRGFAHMVTSSLEAG